MYARCTVAVYEVETMTATENFIQRNRLRQSNSGHP